MAVAAVMKVRDVTSRKRNVMELTFSGTYTTGGETPTGGWKKTSECYTAIEKVNVDSGGAAATGVVARYDHVNDKLMLFRVDQIDDAMEELPNATAIAQVLRAEFVGY